MCRLYSQRRETPRVESFLSYFTTFIDRPQHPSRYIYFHFLCPLLLLLFLLHFTIISHPADTHTISCLLFLLLLLLLLVPCLLFPIGHERMLLFAFVVDLQQSSFFFVFFLLLLLRTMGFVNEFKWLLAPWGRSLASHFSWLRVRRKKGTQKFPPRVLKEKWGGGSSAQMSQHQSRKNESRCVFLNLFSFCCVGQIFFFPTQSGDCV